MYLITVTSIALMAFYHFSAASKSHLRSFLALQLADGLE